jgi:uncharacterized protein (TIGR04255 family)
MIDAPSSGGGESLPDFDNPPVVEVALGVQFRPQFGLRSIELASLRERWRADYPIVQEQPPVAPAIEEQSFGPPTVQLVVGPALQTRLWFLSTDEAELVQLQHDRFTVNWRQIAPDATYPRYPSVKTVFERRWREVSEFVTERQLGALSITQVELNYINAIDPGPNQLGRLERLLRNWQPTSQHHLGDPEQARLALVFGVPGVGRDPVRLYVAVDPAQRPDGQPVLFLTLTIRGAPADDKIEAALRFMDEAHGHIVRSFAELTPETMHTEWGRHQ